MMELGSKAPDFTLPDTISGNTVTLSEVKSDTATVVIFICNHCPFVHHINSKLVEIANIYQAKGIQFIAISSNDIDYSPEDGPKYMSKIAKMEGYTFPYLYDATQEVAKAYNAVCTPDFFVFDGNLECAYRGRFDETRPGMGRPTGKDLSNALDALLAGEKVTIDQKPSMGCSIKWK
ncbi:PPO candidate 1 [Cyclobacterium qasimii M12-11B]|nr:PPO candidate 1 [Cyclobacterium qasimii M12-11B]